MLDVIQEIFSVGNIKGVKKTLYQQIIVPTVTYDAEI